MNMQFSLITLDASSRLLVFWECNAKSTWYFWIWHFHSGSVTISQSCTERFEAVSQIYIYKFIHIYERQKEKERERDWALQQSGSLPRAPLHPVNKQNTGQLNITCPFMSRPQERERERGRQMRYCGSNRTTWDACCRNSPEVKLNRASRGQACPFLSTHKTLCTLPSAPQTLLS